MQDAGGCRRVQEDARQRGCRGVQRDAGGCRREQEAGCRRIKEDAEGHRRMQKDTGGSRRAALGTLQHGDPILPLGPILGLCCSAQKGPRGVPTVCPQHCELGHWWCGASHSTTCLLL